MAAAAAAAASSGGAAAAAAAVAAPVLSQRVLLWSYGSTLRMGRLHRRYKRFLADVVFENEDIARPSVPGATTTVHCPNTGAMTGLLDALPAPAACSTTVSATRKYAHTLEALQLPAPAAPCSNGMSGCSASAGAWVGVHAARANAFAAALLRAGLLPEEPLGGAYTNATLRTEVTVPSGPGGGGVSESGGGRGGTAGGKKARGGRGSSSSTAASRVDFTLTHESGRTVYIEVKSVTLALPAAAAAAVGGGVAPPRESPAAPSTGTARKRRHPSSSSSSSSSAGNAMAAEEVATSADASTGTLVAMFPDAVSVRAQRHVAELARLARAGHGAACVFVIQRADVAAFAPASHVDAEYAASLRAAAKDGVGLLAAVVEPDPLAGGVFFRGCVPVLL